jgi:hypothetical protein
MTCRVSLHNPNYSNFENLVLGASSEINPLCHNQIPWGNGKLECWNIGSSGMRSFTRKMALIRDYNQNIIRFSYPTFHFSTIPIFHSVSMGKHHPFGVNQSLVLGARIFYKYKGV